MSKHIIIYSHGFGVQKDDRGLLSDIAAAIPGAEHVLFDYNQIDQAANMMTVAPLQDQVSRLKEVIAETRAKNPGATLDIVGHSQGCVVIALARPADVRRAIFLAPPTKLSSERLVKLFAERPGSEIHLDGISRLARRDGSTTIVPPGYWASLKGLQLVPLYNQLSQATEVTIIEATQDEVLGVADYDGISERIKIEVIDANHDFTGGARRSVVEKVGARLSSA